MEQPGIPTPLTGAYAELDPDVGKLIDKVLSQRAPELHAHLAGKVDVTDEEAREVGWALYLEFSQQLGEDWEPTQYGKQLDDAIGAFVQHFVIDRQG